MKVLQQAVLQTLVYSDLFNFPLHISEILPRTPHKLTSSQLRAALFSLSKQDLVRETDDYWHLLDRKSLVSKRKIAERISRTKFARAIKFARSLAKSPSIIAVFATGSLAVKNADSTDDIDLMIITRSNMLWTTRIILTPILDALNIRRRPGDTRAKDKMCLNIYISEDALTVPTRRRSLYTAYELIQAAPLTDKRGVATRLLSDNSWISDYLPNINLNRPSPTPSRNWNPLEDIAFKIQTSYMKSKKTREYITPTSAFFHPRNTAGNTLKSLSRRMKEYGLKTI